VFFPSSTGGDLVFYFEFESCNKSFYYFIWFGNDMNEANQMEKLSMWMRVEKKLNTEGENLE
jgi:hypothetical protein